VKDFDVFQYWDKTVAKRQDRYAHFAMAAAKSALADGKLDTKTLDPTRFGVLVGSGVGGLDAVERSCDILFNKGPKRISPFLLPSIIGNTAGAMIAIEVGAQGPNFGIVSACATGTHAIGEALKYLKWGECDVMLAGGSEATITPVSRYSSFPRLIPPCPKHSNTSSGRVQRYACGRVEGDHHAGGLSAPPLVSQGPHWLQTCFSFAAAWLCYCRHIPLC
jgi:hypothetical protein